MKDASTQVNAYIEKAAEFARPILEKVRAAFLKADPGIREEIKWGCPHFVRKGILGGMAAFKQHATFGFWKGGRMKDPRGIFRSVGKTGMCAVKISEVSQLPSDSVLAAYIREAVTLDDSPESDAAKPKRATNPLKVPPKLMAALRRNKTALVTFEAFPPSHKREYIEWVAEAKQEETRARRLATAVEWIAKGKHRNWKYE